MLQGSPRLAGVFALLLLVFFIYGSDTSQLKVEDALYLTKNSFMELKQQYFPDRTGVGPLDDIEYPINNLVNSIFPIDASLEMNTTDGRYYEIEARYASFSPILNGDIEEQYRIFPGDGCGAVNASDYPGYANKILVILRGKCTFVKKVENLVNSGLTPASIIIANDEPLRSLITMYSSSFNEDRTLTVPIMFITNESYNLFKKVEDQHNILFISTTSFGNWVNVVVSLVLSPPLLIIFFYCLIQGIQNCRKYKKNKNSEKIVRNLPVYIYNTNHLINYKHFYEYLNITGQINDLEVVSSNSSIDSVPKPSPSSSSASMNNFVINGCNIKKCDLNILIMNEDFYPSYKCSICLESFKPLKSRVLILDCKHFFHENCLSNWLINFKRSCPLCNTSVHKQVNELLAGQVRSYGSVDEEAAIGFDSSSNEEDGHEEVSYGPRSHIVPANTGQQAGRSTQTAQSSHDQPAPSVQSTPPAAPASAGPSAQSIQSASSRETFVTSNTRFSNEYQVDDTITDILEDASDTSTVHLEL